jgi:hypothetical protein
MKSWTDSMAEAVRGVSLRIAYQFDGRKLRLIHLIGSIPNSVMKPKECHRSIIFYFTSNSDSETSSE